MSRLYSYQLKNGLHVLAYPDRYAPKVSIQLWYGVGSKDEKAGEKGLAHLLEHMIFKGTARLSESDINLITHKLSGYANAFTSYDYTGYMFDFPRRYWKTALDLLSDSMTNCTFKQDFLQAELKAVIQELKMYKDDYASTLIEEMISLIFHGHPYHYPIIGYKQDLCAITQENLHAFYKKHYVPNNATLVVVGDIDPNDVYTQAQYYFGSMVKDSQYKKQQYPVSVDIGTKQIILYRDVEQPVIMIAWKIPGLVAGQHFYFDIFKWLLAQGHGSRLYKKLIDEVKLATDVDSFTEDLFDQSLLFVRIYPKDMHAIDGIMSLIKHEIEAIQKNGFSALEYTRAIQQVSMHHKSLFEQTSDLAYAIGHAWLATQDTRTITHYLDHSMHEIGNAIEDFLPLISITRMHEGRIYPLVEKEHVFWQKNQKESDQWDEEILSRKIRTSEIEAGSYVDKIQVKEPIVSPIPLYNEFTAKNGLSVITCFHDRADTVVLQLSLHARHSYDPASLSGLSHFVYMMLQEGTQKYPGTLFMQTLESYGMILDVSAGTISLQLLKNDLEKGFEFLMQMITEPLFHEDAIEKVRMQIISELHEYWDTPTHFITTVAERVVYKGHPLERHYLGSLDTVARITREDILNFWKNFVSPDRSYLAVVGFFDQKKLTTFLDASILLWNGPQVPLLSYPSLLAPKKEIINYKIQRDQVALCIAGLSVSRLDAEYDGLLLFDQILTGGMLGSMSSRLFALREKTGLFYTVGGSVMYGSGREPGMVMIKTIVSLDQLDNAQSMIQDTLQSAPQTITDTELTEAKHAVLNAIGDSFSSNSAIAHSLIFLARYDLNAEYIKNRSAAIHAITKEQVCNAAERVLDQNHLIVVRAGRV